MAECLPFTAHHMAVLPSASVCCVFIKADT